MLCQFCGKNPATIHFTEIKDDVKRELHICETCADKKGLSSSGSLPPMLLDLMQSGRREGAEEDLKCPHCGVTFGEFRVKGRFGCPHDYEAFAEPLGPLLEKIHGGRVHVGRLPRGHETIDTGLADRLLRLRRELKDSVKMENYEDAARLRDEIQGLENSLGEPQTPAHED
jgi:protein arginine kinase activator